VEQPIESFEEVDGPVTAGVVIEFSALLNRSAFDQPIIPEDRSLAPAAAFIRSLRAEDWAALVGYDGRPWIEAEFTRNKGLLVDRIRERRRSTVDQVASAFYDAVYLTLDRMKSMQGTKAIVLFSSGWDTSSRRNYGELLDIANASDTTIYSVGMSEEALLFIEAQQDQQRARSGPLDEVFFPDPRRNLSARSQLLPARAALRSLADATGGTSFFPVTENQYDEMLDGIDVHLRSRYRLGFLPRDLQTTDELREISVELAPGSEVPYPDSVTFQHKKGFYF
jgi:VWFA-related protein